MLNKKGGIDEAEDPRTAAIRELREETGVSSAEILAEVKNFSLGCFFWTAFSSVAYFRLTQVVLSSVFSFPMNDHRFVWRLAYHGH